MHQKVIIIGGGAAGFFAAITIAETNPNLEVIILEKGKNVLQKVKISGGGRCNVTHACFTPNELIDYYPRGKKELLGPFHRFMTGDTMEWFENRGVELKIESDNRVFPKSNSSQTIVDCLLNSAEKAGVVLKLNQNVEAISKTNGQYKIVTIENEYIADKLVITTGVTQSFGILLKISVIVLFHQFHHYSHLKLMISVSRIFPVFLYPIVQLVLPIHHLKVLGLYSLLIGGSAGQLF